MKKELSSDKIEYDFNFEDIDLENNTANNSDKEEIYEKIKMALNIEGDGYNIYIVDEFSKDKLHDIKEYASGLMAKKEIQDICYVIWEDEKSPRTLFTKSGYGRKLNDMVKYIQKFYFDITYKFYNGSHRQKEIIIHSIQDKKNYLINKLVDMSEKENFKLKPEDDGFVFIPLNKDGKMMSEGDYNLLDISEKEDIINKVETLKKSSGEILDKLKEVETEQLGKLKSILREYYLKNTISMKKKYMEVFKYSDASLEFLNYICKSVEDGIINAYSINYENDEKIIKHLIFKYSVNVLVDNSGSLSAPVVFEEDPNVVNLIGNIEYESKDGSYVTGLKFIKPGSILKANGGCLILRMSSLLNNPNSYYYLKKSILSGKVGLDYKKGYLEILSLGGINPQPVKFAEKIILIGDYATYDFLYNYDADFKNMFKIRAEYNPMVDLNSNSKKMLLEKIIRICRSRGFKSVTDEAFREIGKFLSRKAEDRNKLFIDDYEIEKMMAISNNSALEKNKDYIEREDIEKAVYNTELVEKQIMEEYRENRIFIDITGENVGQVNGLSILSTGYFRFGKPIRITCACTKGDGSIFDVQRESDLSGKIHNKAVNIIKGYINNFMGEYNNLPVNFHVSFEQIYGNVDGDSASVAEVVSIISSISQIGVKQNIAVTGSINQFGKVQPVGGVNEKIEGFFNICKAVGNTQNKGVLIPKSNIKSLALKNEVEEEIKKGNFHIYYMETVEDAIDVLMGKENINYDYVVHCVKRECRKYSPKQYRR